LKVKVIVQSLWLQEKRKDRANCWDGRPWLKSSRELETVNK